MPSSLKRFEISLVNSLRSKVERVSPPSRFPLATRCVAPWGNPAPANKYELAERQLP